MASAKRVKLFMAKIILVALVFAFIWFPEGVKAQMSSNISVSKNVMQEGSLKSFSSSRKTNTLKPHKKPGWAIVASLILPGSGEWFLGHRQAARFFWGTELSLWLGRWGMQSYAHIVRKDYQAFAALHAGVNTTGKDEQFWIDVGHANSVEQFNQDRLLARDLQGMYPDDPFYYWAWDSEHNRLEYRRLRLKEHNWRQRAQLVIGGMILNRLLSAIDVLRIIRKNHTQQAYLFSSCQFRQQDTSVALNMVVVF